MTSSPPVAVSIHGEGGDFVVVTSDAADHSTDLPLTGFLGRIRRAFDMDVVFVSQFVEGRRVVRWVDAAPDDECAVPAGASDPLEESYCWHVAAGRLPQVIGDTAREPFALALPGTAPCKVATHVSVPIVLPDGSVYGTACCFNHEVLDAVQVEEQFESLRNIAALLAEAIAAQRRAG